MSEEFLYKFLHAVENLMKVEPGLEQQIVLPRCQTAFILSLESRHTNKLCSIRRYDSSSHLNKAFGCCQKFVNGTYCPPDDQLYPLQRGRMKPIEWYVVIRYCFAR
ncbi:hypothetical protein WN943_000941 [Citrus x changshan-huyou]